MKRCDYIRVWLVTILSIFCFGFFALSAEASIFNYTFTGTGSFGIYDPAQNLLDSYESVDFKVTLQGDSTNVYAPFGLDLTFLANPVSGGISLFDVNTSNLRARYGFADPIEVFVDRWNEYVGFANVSDPFFPTQLAISAPGQVGWYDLASSLGPISSESAPVYDFGTLFTPIFLTGNEVLVMEDLIIEDPTGGPNRPLTFAAAPVPIPPAILLLGSGLLGLIGVRRKRQKNQG